MKQVYLDNQSNTRMDDIVFDSMVPYLKQYYGNPQSIYSLGQISKDAIEEARISVSKLINSKPEEIIFTSCGSGPYLYYRCPPAQQAPRWQARR